MALRACTGFLLFGALLATSGSSQESRTVSIPRKLLADLETAAQLMVRDGWTDEAQALAAVMTTLGYGEASAEKLRQSAKAVPKGKKRVPVPQVVRMLKASTLQIAKALPPGDTTEIRAAAEAVLAIDSSVEILHQRLGREKTSSGWRSPEQSAAAARRSKIQAALLKARRLQPEVTVEEGSDPVIQEIHGTGCTKASSHGVTVWSRWSREKLRRVLVEALRASAVSSYLVKGELAIPTFHESFLILDSRKDYERAIDIALARAWIKESDVADARRLAGFYADRVDLPSYEIVFEQVEAAAEAGLFFACSGYLGIDQMCPPLRTGHVNWVCLSYLGGPMPGVAWIEEVGARRERKTAAGVLPAERAERERILRLADAGLAGSRSWLAYLAARGEDPPFARSIVDQEGKIEGDDRLKCTFVVEFLQEHDELLTLADKTRLGVRESFEQAWGTSFAGFEARWRSWLLGTGPSIVERLDPPKPRALTPSEGDVLARLNDARLRCFKGSICDDAEPSDGGDWPIDLVTPYLEVSLDDALTEGARKHARYLAKHPEQLAAWPDAHEEWPDRPEFSPEGGWAGTHSVIAPGVSTPEQSLNGWLGTFYHRLPLIDPGLMRIGWALENQIAVLDSGSLARPVSGPWHVVWPYDGMTDVPTRFQPELPNPVPGVDQETFGYPLTLQIGRFTGSGTPPSVTIELREGGEKGAGVPCHVSTPSHPSNPDLAIPDAWCLIPKAPLRPATTYHATATWSNGRKIAWRFKTLKG